MTCGKGGCGHAAYVDREFTIASNRYGVERIRLVCVVGHSTYWPPAVAPTEKEVQHQKISEGRRKHTHGKHDHGCAACGWRTVRKAS